jgi:hypothetical protein
MQMIASGLPCYSSQYTMQTVCCICCLFAWLYCSANGQIFKIVFSAFIAVHRRRACIDDTRSSAAAAATYTVKQAESRAYTTLEIVTVCIVPCNDYCSDSSAISEHSWSYCTAMAAADSAELLL